jgi:hypothetical protein
MTEYPKHWGDDIRPWKLLAFFASEPELGPLVEDALRAVNRRLAPRTTETIATRVATLRSSDYVWRGHAYLSTVRLGVLTVDEVARIAAGPHALSGRDAILVRAVDELLNGRLGAASKAALGTEAGAITIATGLYDLVAVTMSGVEPERDVPVVPGLETPVVAIRSLAAASAVA